MRTQERCGSRARKVRESNGYSLSVYDEGEHHNEGRRAARKGGEREAPLEGRAEEARI